MKNIIQFETRRRSSDAYGEDYLTELRRVIATHVRPVTGDFLEWGAGHTTLALAEMRDELAIGSLTTIDDNGAYLATVCSQMPEWDRFESHCADLTGPKLSNRDPELNYATLPLGWGRTFDFIYIDGRRRLECAFIATLVSHAGTVVAMHDYRRGRYQPVKALFDIVEDGTQFRVMRPKSPGGVEGARAWREQLRTDA